MAEPSSQPTTLPEPALIDMGVALYEADEDEALSVLGIQAEAVEINARRAAESRPVPAWSNEAAFDRVLSPQRAPTDELARYAVRGGAFAQDLLERLGGELRDLLCIEGKVREEILALEGETKDLIKYVAGAATGLIAAYFPVAVAAAIGAIAITLAVIILKRNLHRFCLAPPIDFNK